MEGQTDWVSAVAILASGLILGLMVIVYLSRRKAARAAAPAELPDRELQDLEAKRDLYIAQIRELDDIAVTPSPVQVAERRRLEIVAADVLRQIDEHQKSVKVTGAANVAASAVEAEPAAPIAPPVAAARGFLYGAISAGVLVGLGFFVYNSATSRGPNDGPTGSAMAPNEVQRPAASDPQILALEASVAKNPKDVEQRVELARAYLQQDNLMKVFEHTNIILADVPDEPRALTYNALVRMAMDQQVEATKMLQKANTIAPELIDASVALAWAYTQQKKSADAEVTMLAAMQRHPDEKVRLQEVLTDMKNYKPQPMKATGPVDPNAPLPPGHPPVDGSAPAMGGAMAGGMGGGGAAPPRSNDPKAVKITLSADPAALAKVQGGRLFVIARAAGVSAGPPSGVKAIAAPTFPLTVDMSASDSMMGQPLPEKMRIDVRLDADGDAKTKGPSDLAAVLDGVAAGSSITLKLQ